MRPLWVHWSVTRRLLSYHKSMPLPFAMSSSQRVIASTVRYQHKRGNNGETRASCWIFIGRIRRQLGHFGGFNSTNRIWAVVIHAKSKPNRPHCCFCRVGKKKGKKNKITKQKERKVDCSRVSWVLLWSVSMSSLSSNIYHNKREQMRSLSFSSFPSQCHIFSWRERWRAEEIKKPGFTDINK